MHFHASAIQAVALAPIVLLINLVMRLLAAKLTQSNNPTIQNLGQGLLFIA